MRGLRRTGSVNWPPLDPQQNPELPAQFYLMEHGLIPAPGHRQAHIRNKNCYATNCIELFKAFDFLRQSGGYDIIKSVIAPTLM